MFEEQDAAGAAVGLPTHRHGDGPAVERAVGSDGHGLPDSARQGGSGPGYGGVGGSEPGYGGVGGSEVAHPGFDPGADDSATFSFEALGPDPLELDPWEALESRHRVPADGAAHEVGSVHGVDHLEGVDSDHDVGPRALVAEEMTGLLPGPELAYLLDRGSLDATDDYALVETIAAWQRMAAWAAAGAAHAAAVLADRPSMNPSWPDSAGKVSELNVAGEELAMRLSCSRLAARTLVREGRAYDGPLAATGEALARGEIDQARARVLVRALDEVSVPLALDVQQIVLPGAPARTPTQLSRDVARALIVADPAGAEDRRRVAERGRRVDRPKFLPDGMAGVWAVLPAPEAVRLDACIDTLAQSGRTGGDPRTLDQLRADILVDLTLGRCDPPKAPHCSGTRPPAAAHSSDTHPPASSGVQQPRRAGPRSQIRVTVPLSALLGTDRPAPTGADGTAAGGTKDGDLSRRAAGTGPPDTAPATVADTAADTAPDAVADTAPAIPPGAENQVAELAGYGPITAEAAMALARDGTWRRLVTDPLSGAVLDVGRTTYRPPADLAEHVRARDRYCARPGCSARAESCDLDHTIEYGRDHGTTSDTNLGPLCPRDHAVKTDGGSTLFQITPGAFEWCTPTGHRYRVVPGEDGPVRRIDPERDPPPY